MQTAREDWKELYIAKKGRRSWSASQKPFFWSWDASDNCLTPSSLHHRGRNASLIFLVGTHKAEVGADRKTIKPEKIPSCFYFYLWEVRVKFKFLKRQIKLPKRQFKILKHLFKFSNLCSLKILTCYKFS